jgi:hypothetical protein
MSRKLQLARIENLLQRLDAAVVVRDPGSARAAEMYEGLRRQIVQSGKNHRTHLSHLLALQDSIDRGADIDLVRERVAEYLKELGIQKYSDTSNIDSFEVIEGEGTDFECIEPAIVEMLEDGSIRTHQLGKARRIQGSAVAEPISPESDPDKSPNRNYLPEAPSSKNRLIRVLIAILILIIGIRLGGTLFDDSDAQKAKTDTSTPTTSTVPPTTTTTIPPATTTTTS